MYCCTFYQETAEQLQNERCCRNPDRIAGWSVYVICDTIPGMIVARFWISPGKATIDHTCTFRKNIVNPLAKRPHDNSKNELFHPESVKRLQHKICRNAARNANEKNQHVY
jgi:hypothetical protein